MSLSTSIDKISERLTATTITSNPPHHTPSPPTTTMDERPITDHFNERHMSEPPTNLMPSVLHAQAQAQAQSQSQHFPQVKESRDQGTSTPPDLHLSTSPPWASKLAAVYSPCFFHHRFDDAVNIDKIVAELQEGQEDSSISHSKLMQTAIGVREVGQQLQRRPIKRAVRNIMIVTKARDNHLVVLTRELAEWLISTPRYGSELGVNVYVDAKLRNSERFDAAGLVQKDARFESMLRYWTPDLCWRSPEKFDLVLTLGGDGTVLYTSWLFQRVVPPVLSFSLGSLGFMTPFAFQDFRNTLDKIMGDAGMRVNMRMRFTCTVFRAQKKIKGSPIPPPIESEQFEVLNEVLVDRGPSPYVSSLELYGDDNLLTVIQADGCIFSTPTGSTAYSLSAGGSLVHPDIPALLLTPICPHSLSFRPMLLNDTMALRVAVPRRSRATAHCAFDGKNRVELRQGDSVTIVASRYPFPTVSSSGTEWFDSISKTLRWNMRGATQKGWGGKGDEEPNATAGASIKGGSSGILTPIDSREEDQDVEEEDSEDEDVDPSEGEMETFDIDFDDDLERDSTYSTGESSNAAGPSPRRGKIPTW